MDLALFRNSRGEIGCVVDQCPHRGAALSKGRVVGNCIKCPFHGLEFDKDGKCTLVPAIGKNTTEDISRYNVRRCLVREEHGIIYLWYGDEEKPPVIYHFLTNTWMTLMSGARWKTIGMPIILGA